MRSTFTPYYRLASFLLILLSSLEVFAQPDVHYDQNFITTGLSSPMDIANAGDGSNRLFIAERAGTIRVWQSGNSVIATPFLTVSGVGTTGERGLLSLAFHPDYQSNGLFYVYYARSSDGAIVIAQHQNPNPSDNIAEGTRTELLVIPHPGQTNHYGGHLHFRVEGGINYLYFATGDGGGANDPDDNAQDMSSYLGKMIRINVDLPPYTPEIRASGLRNPFRWSFDRLNGDMWIGDVGQGLWEEVNYIPAATTATVQNFGWPCFEGLVTNPNESSAFCGPPPTDRDPLFVYPNPGGAGGASSAVTGGYVYRGSLYDDMYGYCIASDYYSGETWLLKSGESPIAQGVLATGIVAYGEGEDGELYAVSLTANEVFRIYTDFTLPAGLLNFTAKAFTGYNDLSWSTSFEQNADKYIVEYGRDGIGFGVAGEIAAINNPSGHNYSFRHSIAATGKIFYRLKMLDADGSFKYSSVIVVTNEPDKNDIRVYPTIINSNQLQLVANIPLERLSVFNTNGKEVFGKYMNGMQGYFSIPLPALTKGIYLVRINGKDFQKTERIIIQ